MRYWPKLALPRRAYQPGSEVVPEKVDVGAAPLRRETFREHAALPSGIDLFNGGFFWEAHEVWESAWLLSSGPERELLQALIQLAAARLQTNAGNVRGAATLTERAGRHIANARAAGAIACGLDLDALITDSAATIRWLVRSRDLPETRSLLLVQPLECAFELFGGGVLLTTPGRRDYYSGNAIFADDPVAISPESASTWKMRCAYCLPTYARFHSVSWEFEGEAPPPPKLEGAEVEDLVVLRASAVRRHRQPPKGFEIRELESDADWDAATALSIELNTPRFGLEVAPFSRWRYRAYRESAGVLGGAFFGAFRGKTLAGIAGALPFAGDFRFQEVQTREAFRRRGIASSIILAVFDEMKARGQSRGVIAAERGGDPERIYRRLGFEQVTTSRSLMFKLAEG